MIQKNTNRTYHFVFSLVCELILMTKVYHKSYTDPLVKKWAEATNQTTLHY